MSTVPSGTRFIGISENVNLTERKSAVLNAETQPYTIQDLVDTIGTGAEGPQGVEGPAGPPGPVGPAGLEWQGEWVSGTSYVEDDAVGYDGASWFCILATSGTTAPDVDSTHWALLASQGAIGPQGAQGPTGPQGPAGTASLSYQSYVSLVSFGSDGSPQVITAFSDIQDGVDITLTGTGVYQISSIGRFTSNKTIINPFAYQGSTTNSGAVRLPIYSSDAIVGYYWLQRVTASQIRLNVVDTSQLPVNPFTLLGSRRLTIDIKVYN